MADKNYQAPAAASTLRVLEFMASNPGSWGPTELARRLELSSNLAFRVLTVLQEMGYARRTPAGQYELTAGLYSLGMKLQTNFDLRKQARPFLEALAADSRESCQIQIPAGDRMLQLDFVPPPAEYYLAVTPGIRLHWHGNAFGMAVLAFLPPEEQDKVLGGPLPRITPHTVVDPAVLRERLASILQTRSASEFSEYVLGSYCIGSPVFNAVGRPVAGVGITGLASRLREERLPELRKLVLDCAEKISKSIGYMEDAL